MTLNDSMLRDEVVVPPFAPPGKYELLWSGDKYGGHLYITREIHDLNLVYYVLEFPNNPECLIGYCKPFDSRITGQSPEQIVKCILDNVETMYLKLEQNQFDAALKSGEVTRQ